VVGRIMTRIMARVVMIAVVTIIATKVVWIGVVIGVRVIVCFRIELLLCICVIPFLHWRTMTLGGISYSIFNKGYLTDRTRASKMIFPCFKSYSIGSLISDKVSSPPRRDYFFFGHVRPNIRNMTRVA
jgi:choline-glycine betaine transporter